MLKVEHIDFYYGEVQILKDVSLSVEQGEFVTLFGPNGHGKSTLLKNVCGLLRPAAGSIQFDGQDITRLPIQAIVESGLVYIPEARNLFVEMTVRENLVMGAYCRHARPKLQQNLEQVYHLFPKLKALDRRLAGTLSGGEARMLTIGRGLMSAPRFVAIDEPSFGLAPKVRVDVFQAISEIRKSGVSVLLVEQSTSIASHYADRVYVLEDGGIVFGGNRDQAMNNEQFKEVFLGM